MKASVRSGQRDTPQPLRYTYYVVAITMLATLLRFYALDRQGLWNDEGISYVRGISSFRTDA
ncbi:MAG: hypothetical protein A2Y73_06580 [Chloroflexi bacterium RBG_13_56_8]|nr:MAG: hypothetical protein A2Y73_06580 [Chloroflexi bacterium RBG_13_56_8]